MSENVRLNEFSIEKETHAPTQKSMSRNGH